MRSPRPPRPPPRRSRCPRSATGRGTTQVRAHLAPPLHMRQGPPRILQAAASTLSPMPTTLVTGGAGFLGSHLCDHLLAKGHRVICVDNLDTGSLNNIEHIRTPEFSFEQLDIT